MDEHSLRGEFVFKYRLDLREYQLKCFKVVGEDGGDEPRSSRRYTVVGGNFQKDQMR